MSFPACVGVFEGIEDEWHQGNYGVESFQVLEP